MASDEVPINLKDVASVPDGTAGAQAGLDNKLAGLSLASRAIHAENGIQSHRAVAPAMHVSTTFRYNDDPDALRAWDNTDVSADLFLCWVWVATCHKVLDTIISWVFRHIMILQRWLSFAKMYKPILTHIA